MLERSFGAAAILTVALILSVGTASGQQSPGTAAGQSVSSQRGAFSNAAHASDIIGKKALSTNGETVGSIDDLLITADGRVQAAVVDVGGFLGMGQHTVAIDWKALRVSPSNDRVTISMTKEELKAAPEYDKTTQAKIPNSGEQSSQRPEAPEGSTSNPR